MKERPILFKGPMVRAILSGQKVQTRRVVKSDYELTSICTTEQWCDASPHPISAPKHGAMFHTPDDPVAFPCPYGKAGDRLWIKETHYRFGQWVKNGFSETGRQKWKFKALSEEVRYFDNEPSDVLRNSCRETIGWYRRPSLFMPRRASRITLEITGIRVERLNDISERDAKNEGISGYTGQWEHYGIEFGKCGNITCSTARMSFQTLWESINGPDSWSQNPWVWIVEFKNISEDD